MLEVIVEPLSFFIDTNARMLYICCMNTETTKPKLMTVYLQCRGCGRTVQGKSAIPMDHVSLASMLLGNGWRRSPDGTGFLCDVCGSKRVAEFVDP